MARKATFLLKNFDVKTLTKLDFFDKDYETDELVDKVLTFFGYSSIQEYEDELVEPLYSKTKRNFSDKMKDFWIKSAYQTFRIIDNPNEYDRRRLKDLIVKVKPYSQDVKEGLFTVCKALYNIGVTVIFQDYLSTTQVRGGTFIVNGKPCIVLTDYKKKYPTIWFTLLHELHHVLFDFDLIETNSFHLTGDDDLFLIEDKEVAITEMLRTLRPGGQFIIVDWTESFAGLGPQPGHVFPLADTVALLESQGCTFEREFPAGDHHYGVAFKK